MSQGQRRSSAPRVEMDSGGPEPRVPPIPGEEDDIDGEYLPSVGRYDSGFTDSYSSLQSGDSGVAERLGRLSMRDTQTAVPSMSESDSSDSNSGQTSFTFSDSRIATASIDDEAYVSGGTLSGFDDIEDQKRRFHEAELAYTQDEDGDTQLHISIIQGVTLMTRHLIDLAPSTDHLNLQNDLLQTGLHLAALTNQPEIVRELVIRNAPLDTRDHNGNTALHLACREGLLDVVQALCNRVQEHELPFGPMGPHFSFTPPNLTSVLNYDGYTCVHLAAARGFTRIIDFLVERPVCANINCKDGRSGRTALHYAVEANSMDMVLFLVRHCGADVNARTFDGSTPLMLAHGRGHDYIQTFLQNAGADPNQIGLDWDSDSESDEEMMEAAFSDFGGAQAIST